LVFPDHLGGCYTDGGLVLTRIAAVWRVARGAAVYHHVPVDGCAPRHAGLHFGTRTNPARLAHFANATDLSADAQLLHLESDPARDQRRMGELGQTRTHRQRACPGVIAKRGRGSGSALAITNFQSIGLFTPMPGVLSLSSLQYCNPELGEEIFVSYYDRSSNHSYASSRTHLMNEVLQKVIISVASTLALSLLTLLFSSVRTALFYKRVEYDFDYEGETGPCDWDIQWEDYRLTISADDVSNDFMHNVTFRRNKRRDEPVGNLEAKERFIHLFGGEIQVKLNSIVRKMQKGQSNKYLLRFVIRRRRF
jgi:hypothetical protein